jgi:putative endonuclease
MHYVYILNSVPFPDKFYVGYTLDISNRLKDHNESGSVHTKEYKPWKIIWYCMFVSKEEVDIQFAPHAFK